MAGQSCINKNLPEWAKLVALTGDETIATRMYYQNEASSDPLGQALDKFDITKFTVAAKEKLLEQNSSLVKLIEDFDEVLGQKSHIYRDSNNKEIPSTSRRLDEFSGIHFNGKPAGTIYSEIGSKVHKVLEDYVNLVVNASDAKLGEVNVKARMVKDGIPDAFYNQISSFVNSLKGGKLITERGLIDKMANVAGTVDLLHIKDDGSIDMYDFKTAHKTPSIRDIMIDDGGGIWNPKKHFDGYKANRYSAQLGVYATLVENVLGQPISNKYILPIELTYTNIDDPTQGIESVSTLAPENVNDYGTADRSKEIVDRIFGNIDETATYSIDGANEISDTINTLTGQVTSRKGVTSAQYAENLLRRKNSISHDGRSFLMNGEWIKFDGKSSAEKQAQVTRLFQQENPDNLNAVDGIKNYMRTGEDSFISSNRAGAANTQAIIEPYRELYGGEDFDNSGLKVYSLSDIKGFTGMNSWIVFEKEGVMDLIYMGADDLGAKLMMRKGFGRETVFGKYMDSFEAKNKLGSSLKNDWGSVRQIEATLITMKLKNQLKTKNRKSGQLEDAKIKFGAIIISSTSVNSEPIAVNLNQMLPMIEKMSKNETISKLLPDSMKAIFNEKDTFNRLSYDQDFLKSYLSLISYADLKSNKNFKLKDRIASYTDGKLSRTRITKYLLEHIKILSKNLERDPTNKVLTDEIETLSQSIFQLKRIPNDMRALNKLYKDFQMPQNIPNRILQALALTVQNGVNAMQREFVTNFKNQSNKDLRKFFDSQRGIFGKYVLDTTLAQTTRYYDVIKNKREFDVPDVGTMSKRTMHDFTLIGENTAEYKKLSSAAQQEITRYNDLIEKYARMAGMVDEDDNVTWERGRVPLVKASFSNKVHQATRDDAGKQSYGGIFLSLFETVEDNFGLGENTVSTKTAKRLTNSFLQQADTSKRRQLLGMNEDESSIDPDKAGGYETNLEVALDVFAMTAIRMQVLNEAEGMFIAAETVTNMYKTKYFQGDVISNLDWLDIWRTKMLHNRDKDAGTVFNKGVKIATAITSAAMLTYKPLSPLIAGLGQQFNTSSQLLTNLIVSKGAVNIKDLTKAIAWMANPKNFILMDKIIDSHGVANMDAIAMTNSYKREGESKLFSIKGGYWGFSAADYIGRGQVLIAQMIRDDALRQYSIDDAGNIKFDETVGDRFKGVDGKLKLEYFKERAANENTLDKDGNLTRAYDDTHVSKVKALMNSIIGGMDVESRSTFGFEAKGKMFGQFLSWAASKINRAFAEDFQSEFNGNLVKQVDPFTGKDVMVYEGSAMEGLFQTYTHVGYNIIRHGKSDWSNLTDNQKNNIVLTATNLLHYAILTMISSIAGLANDDDDKEENITQTILRRSIEDLMAMYRPDTILSFVTTPVLIVQMQRTYASMMSVATGSSDNGKKFVEYVKLPYVGKRIDEFSRLLNIDIDE